MIRKEAQLYEEIEKLRRRRRAEEDKIVERELRILTSLIESLGQSIPNIRE